MGEPKRLVAYVVALAGIAVALLLPWWKVSAFGASLALDLRGAEICEGGVCVRASAQGFFSGVAWATFITGIVAAINVAIAAGLIIATGSGDRMSKGVFGASVAFGACALLTWLSVDDAGGLIVPSLSWGLPGALIGAVAGAIGATSLVDPRRDEVATAPTAPVTSTLADPRTVIPARPARAPIDLEPPARPDTVEYQRAIAAATRTADGKRVASRGAPVAGVDATRSALRFVVATGDLGDAGLSVKTEDGEARRIAWTELALVVARRLPPDPPFDKTLVVDLIPAVGPPLRLLPSSRLDYRRLPGGAAPTAKENLRRLVALAREHHPGLEIEAESARFFEGAGDAPMFGAIRQFAEYDARY